VWKDGSYVAMAKVEGKVTRHGSHALGLDGQKIPNFKGAAHAEITTLDDGKCFSGRHVNSQALYDWFNTTLVGLKGALVELDLEGLMSNGTFSREAVHQTGTVAVQDVTRKGVAVPTPHLLFSSRKLVGAVTWRHAEDYRAHSENNLWRNILSTARVIQEAPVANA
jgi:hypothetical protein